MASACRPVVIVVAATRATTTAISTIRATLRVIGKLVASWVAAGGLSTFWGRNIFSRSEVEIKLAKYTNSAGDERYAREAVYIDEIEIFNQPEAASKPVNKTS